MANKPPETSDSPQTISVEEYEKLKKELAAAQAQAAAAEAAAQAKVGTRPVPKDHTRVEFEGPKGQQLFGTPRNDIGKIYEQKQQKAGDSPQRRLKIKKVGK